LEGKAYSPELADIQKRLAALEQGRWQNPGGVPSGAGGLQRAVVTGGSIATGASGDVTIYDASGTATSQVVSATLWLTGPIANGTKVYITPMGNGYDIVQANCP
jgi:hypothetical protein